MNMDSNNAFSMIADYEGDVNKLFEDDFCGKLPVLATRNLIPFPGIITPILIGRKKSVKLINHLKERDNTLFAIFCQKDSDKENPGKDDLYDIGVYAKILRVLEIPGNGGNFSVIVQSMGAAA